MEETSLPVLYLKKENGGVHTARNVGYCHARGELVIGIDSDDELLPEACQIFYDEWNKMPGEKRKQCFQIKALCVDAEGKLMSDRFPENITFVSENTLWLKLERNILVGD